MEFTMANVRLPRGADGLHPDSPGACAKYRGRMCARWCRPVRPPPLLRKNGAPPRMATQTSKRPNVKKSKSCFLRAASSDSTNQWQARSRERKGRCLKHVKVRAWASPGTAAGMPKLKARACLTPSSSTSGASKCHAAGRSGQGLSTEDRADCGPISAFVSGCGFRIDVPAPIFNPQSAIAKAPSLATCGQSRCAEKASSAPVANKGESAKNVRSLRARATRSKNDCAYLNLGWPTQTSSLKSSSFAAIVQSAGVLR